MARTLDHVVLWVADPLASVEFYEKVVGLEGVRVAEFREGKTPFLSVRISETALIDLAKREMAPMLNGMSATFDPRAAESAGHPVHHVCIAMSEAEFEELRQRLTAAGKEPKAFIKNSFGARGTAPSTFYFTDLDGNVLEARHY